MLVFLTTFLAILPSMLRSGAALELEILALRHPIGASKVRRKTPEINPVWSKNSNGLKIA
jgi:hypothetical protein